MKISVLLLPLILAAGLSPLHAEDPKPVQASGASGFPVKSEWFEQIEDSYDDQEAAMKVERLSMLDILRALKASTPTSLEAGLDKTADYKSLMIHPEKFRGHVARLDGTFRYKYDSPQALEDTDITLYRGQISSRGNVISFAAIEPLPATLNIGDTVRFTGIFMKRYAYLNRRKPGAELTWTPYLFIRTLEPYKPTDTEDSVSNLPFVIGNVLFVFFAVAMFFYMKGRSQSFARRNNPFTQRRRNKG